MHTRLMNGKSRHEESRKTEPKRSAIRNMVWTAQRMIQDQLNAGQEPSIVLDWDDSDYSCWE